MCCVHRFPIARVRATNQKFAWWGNDRRVSFSFERFIIVSAWASFPSAMPSHYLALPLKSSKPAKSVICRITGSPHSFPLTVTATDGEFGFSKKRMFLQQAWLMDSNEERRWSREKREFWWERERMAWYSLQCAFLVGRRLRRGEEERRWCCDFGADQSQERYLECTGLSPC